MSTGPAVEIEHSPARLSGGLAAAAGLIAVFASGAVSTLSLLFGLLGLLGLVAGIFALESRRAVVVGVAVIFVGVLISGLLGSSAELLLPATIGAVLALDLGQNAISIGRQVTTETRTSRSELVHAAVSSAVGVGVAVVAYAIYSLGAAGQSINALAFLLLAAVFLVWSFRT